MSNIGFFAPGIPKGQPRPRAFAFQGRARVFDPGTAEGWKSAVAEAARPFLGSALTAALSVQIHFVFPRPKSHYLPATARRAVAVLREDAPAHHTAKPDADNAAKAVLDALTTLGMWKDDAQVAALTVTKNFGDTPGAHVVIVPLVAA